MRFPIMDKPIREVIGGAGFRCWKGSFGKHSAVSYGIGNGLGFFERAKEIPCDKIDPLSEVRVGGSSPKKILTNRVQSGFLRLLADPGVGKEWSGRHRLGGRFSHCFGSTRAIRAMQYAKTQNRTTTERPFQKFQLKGKNPDPIFKTLLDLRPF